MTNPNTELEWLDEILIAYGGVGYPKPISRQRAKLAIAKHIEAHDLDLLDKYSRFLQKACYIDSDWYTEEPTAINQFLSKQGEK